MNKFLKEVDSFKNIIESSRVTFEGIVYYIINKNNFIKDLQEIFPNNIKELLRSDFDYYINSTAKDKKYLASYNYILKLQDIFNKKENEFNKQNNQIQITTPEILELQKNLLFDYYFINLDPDMN